MSSTDSSSICVLRLSAIGDCCHALALIRTLQRHRPNATLTWIIGKTEANLMQGIDGVELIIYNKNADRSERRAFAQALRARQFDILLNMHASWRANRVSRWIQAPRKIGFDKARAKDMQWLFTNDAIEPQQHPHVIDGFFAFAERLGVAIREYDFRLPLVADHYVMADRLIDAARPLVLISPCSSERRNNFRNWPAERFVDVAAHAMQQHDAIVAVTGGGRAVEHEYAQWICNDGPDGIHNLVGKTSLKELAALIDRASVMICPDSGPAHIAGTVGTPVIGLYATSNPGRTGPVLHPEHTVNAYPEALQRFMGKTVSDVRWGQRVRHAKAMSLIEVDAVKSALDLLLA